MKAFKIIMALTFLTFLIGSSADVSLNFLTKGFADTLYCRVDGGCPTVVATPINISLLTGTLDNGGVENVSTVFDNKFYNISEVGGSPAIEVIVNFTGVSLFNEIILRGHYDGGAGHSIEVNLWNWRTNTWNNYGSITDQTQYTIDTFDVFGFEDYINGTNVSMALNHTNTGNPAHDWSIDFIALGQTGSIYSVPNYGDLFVNITGDTMTGTLYGTDINASNRVNARYLNATQVNARDSLGLWGFIYLYGAGYTAIYDGLDYFSIDPSNHAIGSNTYIKLDPLTYIYLETGANQHFYSDAGGYFYWRDQDDSDHVRASLNSADGSLALGKTFPSERLDVNGSAIVEDSIQVNNNVTVNNELIINNTKFQRFIINFSDSIVGLWGLNDNAANTVVNAIIGEDAQANQNTLGLYYWDGVVKSGFDFDGSSDYVNLSFNDADDIRNTFNAGRNYSVSVWINPDGAAVDFLVYMGDHEKAVTADLFQFDIITDASNLVYCRVWNSGTGGLIYMSTFTTYTPTEWSHVVCAFDSDTPRLYQYHNGVLVSTNTTPLGSYISPANDNLYLGEYVNSIYDYNGKLDSMFLFNKTINQSEVTTLYNLYDGLENDSLDKGLYAEGIITHSNLTHFERGIHSNGDATFLDDVHIDEDLTVESLSTFNGVVHMPWDYPYSNNRLWVNKYSNFSRMVKIYADQVDENLLDLYADYDESGYWLLRIRSDGGEGDMYPIEIWSGNDAGTNDNTMITFRDGDGTIHGEIEIDDGTVQFEQASDERLKENIVNTTYDSLDIVKALKVRDYNRIGSQNQKTGFIAQEVNSVLPYAAELNLIKYKANHTKGEEIPADIQALQLTASSLILNYTFYPKINTTIVYLEQYAYEPLELIPHLVKSIQQLEEKVAILEAGRN